MDDDLDNRIVLPYSSLELQDESEASSQDSLEQDEDGDTNLIIDESSSSTSSQYPVDLSVRHIPVSNHSWFHPGVTSSGDVSIARKPETGFQVPNSLLSILQQPAKSSSGLFVSSSIPTVSPKLVPLTPQDVSSQYNSSNLPDLVQITSNSEGVHSPGSSSSGFQKRKIRKRVLSECMRELNTVQTKHDRLKALHDRLEYRVNRIKAEYIKIIRNQSFECPTLKLCQFLEESGRIKEEPLE